MKKIADTVYFRPFNGVPTYNVRDLEAFHRLCESERIGWHYTRFDPETGEGKGWFGSSDEPSYYFEAALVDGELCQRTCGVGQGCFWTDWR